MKRRYGVVRIVAAVTVLVGFLAMALSAKYQIETKPTVASAALRLATFFTFWSDIVITACAVSVLVGDGPFRQRTWLTRGLLAAILIVLSYSLFQGWSHTWEDGMRNMLGHLALPLLIAFLWLFQPSTNSLNWKDLPLLPAYTLTYITVVFVAGHLFHYYPYDMLNIYVHGYRHFFFVVTATTTGHWVLGAGLILFDKWRLTRMELPGRSWSHPPPP